MSKIQQFVFWFLHSQFFCSFFCFLQLKHEETYFEKLYAHVWWTHQLELMSNWGVMTYFVYFAMTTVVVYLTTAVQILSL